MADDKVSSDDAGRLAVARLGPAVVCIASLRRYSLPLDGQGDARSRGGTHPRQHQGQSEVQDNASRRA